MLDGKRPPYVPWSFSFTQEARLRLTQHFGADDLEPFLQNHLLGLGEDIGVFDDLGHDRVRDLFGVVWNPAQPEVMDIDHLVRRYRRRLTFHGGLSTQRTLPYGSPQDVRAETRRLLELGAEGSYILAPAHAVEGDVPLENILAFCEEALAQRGFTCLGSAGSPPSGFRMSCARAAARGEHSVSCHTT
ncbi:MAG: uroporphyrinogen decarboxylase family protein [bacterium]